MTCTACDQRSGVAAWLGLDPHVNWLWPDPRYREIVRRLGLEVLNAEAVR